MKPILIVQHEADTGPGQFERYLQQHDLPRETVRVFAREPIPRAASAYAGICSLGGGMSVNDDLPWINDEVSLMRDADQCGVPIIGHCLGGQLLAVAFGASVTRSPMKEIGWTKVDVDDANLAREWVGSAPRIDLFQWHGDTFALPTGARRFLTSRLCANQAFVIDREDHTHLGMQFHVEMTPQLIYSWASDPQGKHEIDTAFERQHGDGVQRAEELMRDAEGRTERMSVIAGRIYDRWVRGLRTGD